MVKAYSTQCEPKSIYFKTMIKISKWAQHNLFQYCYTILSDTEDIIKAVKGELASLPTLQLHKAKRLEPFSIQHNNTFVMVSFLTSHSPSFFVSL